MAGEPITRGQIEDNVARYLDRAGDPVITAVTGLWFAQAHRKMQRNFNFSIMEARELTNPLIEGAEQYLASPYLKEIIDGEVIDVFTGEVLQRYRKTDLNTVVRYKMDGGYKEAVFALEGRTYCLWPPTTEVTDVKGIHWHGYFFQPTPELDANDWFTDFGSDYLMYQSLLESVDYVSAPEGRLVAWQERAREAYSELIGMDTQFKISGPMALR